MNKVNKQLIIRKAMPRSYDEINAILEDEFMNSDFSAELKLILQGLAKR